MIVINETEALKKLAERMVWFKEPSDTLADSAHFIAYVLTYGTDEDLAVLNQNHIALPQIKEVLDNPPFGVFNNKSWTYWNLKCGQNDVPPLPIRKFT